MCTVTGAAEPEVAGLDEASFGAAIFNTFTVMTSSGREVPLVPGGQDRPITWENRHDYVRCGTSSRTASESAESVELHRPWRVALCALGMDMVLSLIGATQRWRTDCTSLTTPSRPCVTGCTRSCRPTCWRCSRGRYGGECCPSSRGC
jgi:hypothetical protein